MENYIIFHRLIPNFPHFPDYPFCPCVPALIPMGVHQSVEPVVKPVQEEPVVLETAGSCRRCGKKPKKLEGDANKAVLPSTPQSEPLKDTSVVYKRLPKLKT